MIDKISSKLTDPEGQLEVIDKKELSKINISNDIIKENPQLILAYNQLYYIYQLIDFARHNLIFSSLNMTKSFMKKFMNTDDPDTIESISSFFLSSSILFYNSSFDYLWILLILILPSHQELINKFPLKKVENIINKYKLSEEEWFMALFKKFTELKWEERKILIKSELDISDEMKKKILNIMDKNKILKLKYQANCAWSPGLRHLWS